MEDVVIVSGVRTAIGRFQGSLADKRAHELGAIVIKEAVERAGISPDNVDSVIMGICAQIAEQAYMSRFAAVTAGLPVTVPAMNVNRICGSGLEAINTASRFILSGDAEVVVAGGAESMSNIPYILRDGRSGFRLGHGKVEDALIHILSDPFSGEHMGVTAENLAADYEVSREAQDEFAVESQRRALAAIEAGYFKDQIVPVNVRIGREDRIFDTDEHPRATTMEVLARMRPAFQEGGVVTAGNASGINDGAAAVVVMSASKAKDLGLKPKMRIVARAEAGVEPRIMGSGPIPAVEKALAKASMSLDQMEVIELNEAFASVSCACSRGLTLDPNRTNPNGGAIALGHPVGASGAVLTVKLMYEMERTNSRFGLVSLCIGGGQGIATIFERLN